MSHFIGLKRVIEKDLIKYFIVRVVSYFISNQFNLRTKTNKRQILSDLEIIKGLKP
jgi:hypothetical protein